MPSGEHGKPASASSRLTLEVRTWTLVVGLLRVLLRHWIWTMKRPLMRALSARAVDEIFKNAGIDFFNEPAESTEDLDKVEAEKEVYEKDLDSVESSSTSSSSSSEDMNEEKLHEKLSDQRVGFDFDGPLFRTRNLGSCIEQEDRRTYCVVVSKFLLLSFSLSKDPFSSGQDAGSASKVKCWLLQAKLPICLMRWHRGEAG